MPHTPGGDPVTLNGTTWVPVVAAPGASNQRAVVSLLAINLDNVLHNFETRRNKGGVFTTLHPTVAVGAGLKAQLIDGMVALDATDESIEARLSEIATTQPVIIPAYMEKTP